MRKVSDDEPDRETRLALALVEDTGTAAVAIAGGFLGLIGAPGIILGATAGVAGARLIKHLGAELYERVLAPRQRARALAALWVAHERSRERTEQGEQLRDDAFYGPREGDGGIPAEELLEGVLLRASDAYDQRRVPYLGAFYAAVEHRPDVTPAHAHQLLQLADGLSYRQLVAIALFHDHAGDTALITLQARREEEGHWPFAEGLGTDLQNIANNPELLGIEQSNGSVVAAGATYGGDDVERSNMIGNLRLTSLGGLLYELMDLDRIPEHEKTDMLDVLSRSTWDRPGP